MDVLEPEVFVFENVYGLPGANGGEPWRQVLAAFAEHGYTLEAEVVDAADYGVPQHRERLILVGTKGKKFKFPMPTVGPDSDNDTDLVSVIDAISDLQSPDEDYHDTLGGLYGHLLPEVPEGLNYSYFTAEMGHPEPVFAWRSKFHDLLYKVDPYSPCRTIKAKPGKFTGPFHWKNRHFTSFELKRLQTFPDDYQIIGSYKDILEQIGNSVPPRLAKVLAGSVKEQVLRPVDSLQYPVREAGFKSTFRRRQRERAAKFKNIAQKAIEDKYGKIEVRHREKSLNPQIQKFYASYPDKFDRCISDSKPHKTIPFFEVVVVESDKHVRIDVDEGFRNKESEKLSSEINIEGLSKYLPDFATLRLSATLSDIFSLFYLVRQAWRVAP